MSEENLADQAAKKRREYKRRWNAENRDKVKEHTCRYWERKVLQEQAREVKANDADGNADKQ